MGKIYQLALKLECLTVYAGHRAAYAAGTEARTWEARAQHKEIADIIFTDGEASPVSQPSSRLSQAKKSGTLAAERQARLAEAYEFDIAWPEWCGEKADALAFMKKLLAFHFPDAPPCGDADWTLFSANLALRGLEHAKLGNEVVGTLRFKDRPIDEIASLRLRHAELVVCRDDEGIVPSSVGVGNPEPSDIRILVTNDTRRVVAWEFSHGDGLNGNVSAKEPPWCRVQHRPAETRATVRVRSEDVGVFSNSAVDVVSTLKLATLREAYIRRFPTDPEAPTKRIIGSYRLHGLDSDGN